MMVFGLSPIPLEKNVEMKRARALFFADPTLGGIVTFEGRVRNHHHGQGVRFLEYEVYEALALQEGEKIIQEAMERFEIERIICFHRSGRLEIGELAVWILVGAHHRKGAFLACEYMIDEIKKRLPIWKNEHYADGNSRWVACHDHVT